MQYFIILLAFTTAFKLQEMPPGHPREHPELQNMNFLHFYFG
jgi:hypothetical protein